MQVPRVYLILLPEPSYEPSSALSDTQSVAHIPHQPTFNINKANLFYHNMRQILKNKKLYIM